MNTMKHTKFVCVWMTVFASVCCGPVHLCLGQEPDKKQPKEISVEVFAITAKGVILKDIPLVLITDKEWAAGYTDENGKLALVAEISPEANHVEVKIFGGGGKLGAIFDYPVSKRLLERMRLFKDEYYVKKRHHIQLELSTNEYNVNIIAYSTIRITGVIADHEGQPLGGLVYGRDGFLNLAAAVGGRQFSLNGLKRNAATTIYATYSNSIFNGDLIQPVRIAKDDTRRDFSVGKIELPEVVRDSHLDVILENTDQYNMLPGKYALGVTIINAEKHTAIAYMSLPDRRVPEMPMLNIPAGKYYLAPGWFGATEEQCLLIDWVREGKDLSDADIFTFEIKEGETKEITVNLVEAYHAIRNHAAKLRKHDSSATTAPKPPTPANP